MANVFTDQNFETEVLNCKEPVLVDFWAPWCGPCQIMGPIIDEISAGIGKKAKVGKLNVDENPLTAQKFSVMSIPTIIIFKGGKAAKQLVGVKSKESLMGELRKV